MKTRSISPTLAFVAVACVAGMVLLAPIHAAQAKGGGSRATTTVGASAGAGVGSKVNDVRGATTGSSRKPCHGTPHCRFL